MGNSGAVAMSALLGYLDQLEELDIRSNALTAVGAAQIIDVLTQVHGVRVLLIDHNKLGATGGAIFQKVLWPVTAAGPPKSGAPAGAGEDDDDDDAEDLSLRIDNEVDDPPEAHGLRVLGAGWNNLGDVGVASLMKSLVGHPTLEALDLSGNGASDRAGIAIGATLQSGLGLTELNLEWNLLRGRGASAVCRGLISARFLTTLKLAWNGFGDILALSALAEFIAEDMSLCHLDLSHNRVNDRGAALLSTALESNRKLQRLILNSNPVGQVWHAPSFSSNLCCSSVDAC